MGDIVREISRIYELLKPFEPRIRFFLMQRVSHRDVEDVFQEIRIKFLECYPSLRDKTQLQSFIFQLVRDRLRNHFAREQRLRQYPWSDRGLEEKVPDTTGLGRPEETLLRDERLYMVRTCMMSIRNPDLRRVAELRYRNGLQYDEIADLLNMPINTVKTSIRRAKLAIMECMKTKAGGLP